MSRANIAKLEALLERVQRRRAEPRLLSVSSVRAIESANTNLERPPPTIAARPTPMPVAMPPVDVAQLEPRTSRASSLPPPPPRTGSSTPPRQTEITGRSLTPPGATETTGRAPTEVLPAAPVRIAPAAPAPFDAAVRVASPPRIDTPKTFGELLELSLSLRPK
jgi:hypothetical protein